MDSDKEEPMSVITISRQFGAGGKTIGKKVADSLGYTFADDDIVQQIAEMAKVSAVWVETVEKEAGGRLSRVVSRMVSKPLVDRILKDERGYIDEQIYIDYLVVIIAQIAEEGNAVILGRGSQYILKDMPDAYHVLLINSFENRVRFVMENYGMNHQRASHVVKSEDRRRQNLYRKLGKQDFDRPELYHLVINMERIRIDQAFDMILRLVNQRG
jgi:cytidylate kinase